MDLIDVYRFRAIGAALIMAACSVAICTIHIAKNSGNTAQTSTQITIDYRDDNAKEEVCEALDDLINSDQDIQIQLTHVVSSDFEYDFDLNATTDSNRAGYNWQNTLNYKNYTFKLYGDTWYGKIRITN